MFLNLVGVFEKLLPELFKSFSRLLSFNQFGVVQCGFIGNLLIDGNFRKCLKEMIGVIRGRSFSYSTCQNFGLRSKTYP